MVVGHQDGGGTGLKGIARLAGVSTATVSRVINSRPGVRPELRRRVEQVIREHGLQVNAAARALKSRKTGKLAIITPSRGNLVFSNPFFGEIFCGLATVTEGSGYSLIMMTDATSQTLEEVNRNRSCDGVLLIGFRKGIPEPRSLRGATVPVVSIPRPGPRYKLPYVTSEDETGAYGATSHLIERGRSSIALLSGPSTNVFSLYRLTGYRRALRDAGLKFDPSLVANGEYTGEGAYRATMQLLDVEKPPDAIFATSDYMATGAMSAIRARGLRVPTDVALVGFGNVPLSTHLTPALTTVDERLQELGEQAASLLIHLALGEPVCTTQIVLVPRLVVRDSS